MLFQLSAIHVVNMSLNHHLKATGARGVLRSANLLLNIHAAAAAAAYFHELGNTRERIIPDIEKYRGIIKL